MGDHPTSAPGYRCLDCGLLHGSIGEYATLKNRGTHDIKFTESMLENYRWLRLPWRDALFAASLMYANGSDDPDDAVVVRARSLLGG